MFQYIATQRVRKIPFENRKSPVEVSLDDRSRWRKPDFDRTGSCHAGHAKVTARQNVSQVSLAAADIHDRGSLTVHRKRPQEPTVATVPTGLQEIGAGLCCSFHPVVGRPTGCVGGSIDGGQVDAVVALADSLSGGSSLRYRIDRLSRRG